MHKGHHNLANLFLSQRERPQFPPRKPQHYLQRKASTKKIETLKYQVNTFPPFVKPELIPYLMKNVALFQAGQISKFYKEWEKLSSDPEILEMVQGTTIIFSGKCPMQHQSLPNSLPHAEAAERLIKQYGPCKPKG